MGLKAPIEGYEVQPLPDGDAANLLHERAVSSSSSFPLVRLRAKPSARETPIVTLAAQDLQLAPLLKKEFVSSPSPKPQPLAASTTVPESVRESVAPTTLLSGSATITTAHSLLDVVKWDVWLEKFWLDVLRLAVILF